MVDKVEITKVDEIFLRIDADRGILREMQDHFSFYMDNYKFHPKVRAKAWDGKIRLMDLRRQTIYVGLLQDVISFCEDRGYDLSYDYAALAEEQISLSEARSFVENLAKKVTIPNFEIRDYQVETFMHCVRKHRALFLSPTSSGKSWMIYTLIKYYNLPTLVIVDGTGPVHHMAQDFVEYGEEPTNIHKVFGGQEKYVRENLVVSTWQSLLNMPAGFFDRFGLIIGDEAHHFGAKTFQELMEKIPNAKYRFGFTGTIKGSRCNTMVLEGLFGKVKQIVTTRELMDQGYVADIDIKCIVLQYDDAVKKTMKDSMYQKEMDFITSSAARNNFIKNLAGDLKGNTLIFFNYVDKHGKVLYNLLKDSFPDRRILYVDGGVDGEIRNDIRQVLEDTPDEIVKLTFGSTVLRMYPNILVPLTSGRDKKAEEITIDDDVDPSWINRMTIQFGVSIIEKISF